MPTVEGFAIGINIRSCLQGVRLSKLLSIAMRRAALSVINELTMQVTSINKIVPFNTSSFNNLSPVGRTILYPTNTVAKVAAACALLNPYINIRSTDDIR
ncbi:unknown [Bacteroides sp. CAG:144]|nr:unknown [Bacteroides sp. CAG:144]